MGRTSTCPHFYAKDCGCTKEPLIKCWTEKETANLRSSPLIFRQQAAEISEDERRLAVSKFGFRFSQRFPNRVDGIFDAQL